LFRAYANEILGENASGRSLLLLPAPGRKFLRDNANLVETSGSKPGEVRRRVSANLIGPPDASPTLESPPDQPLGRRVLLADRQPKWEGLLLEKSINRFAGAGLLLGRQQASEVYPPYFRPRQVAIYQMVYVASSPLLYQRIRTDGLLEF
jgi:hypothetical protein